MTEENLKKFKLTWDEWKYEHDAYGDETDKWLEKMELIIEAKDIDAACEMWDKEHANDGTNGLDDIYEIIEHELFNKSLHVEMPDGHTYAVPVEIIARNRAEAYADEYGDDVGESLREDTIPLFMERDYNIRDWASNNMNWDDVKAHARRLERDEKQEYDYEDGWCNGEWAVQ